MKYLKLTFEYIFKNFAYLFFFAIVPAVLLALGVDIEGCRRVAEGIAEGRVGFSFFALFDCLSIIKISSVGRLLWSIGGSIACVFSVSLILAFAEKHMRIGRRSFSGLIGRMNGNVISTTVVLFTLLVIYELWSLITAAVIAVVLMIPVVALQYILGIVLFIALLLFLQYVISLFAAWLPCSIITGFGFLESLQFSNRLADKDKKGICLALAIPYLVGGILCGMFSFFSGNFTYYVMLALLILTYMIFVIYYSVLTFVCYFDLSDTERLDKKKKYGFGGND